jgi:hypothetical protein
MIQYFAWFLSFLLISIIVEWMTIDIKNEYLHPSLYFNGILYGLNYFWEFLGRNYAWVSSFLKNISFKKLLIAINNIIQPTISTLKSPYYFFVGYLSYIRENTSISNLIYIGSYIVAALLLFGSIYFYNKYYNQNYTKEESRSIHIPHSRSPSYPPSSSPLPIYPEIKNIKKRRNN